MRFVEEPAIADVLWRIMGTAFDAHTVLIRSEINVHAPSRVGPFTARLTTTWWTPALAARTQFCSH